MNAARRIALVIGVLLFALCSIAIGTLVIAIPGSAASDIRGYLIGGIPYMIGAIIGIGLIAFGKQQDTVQ